MPAHGFGSTFAAKGAGELHCEPPTELQKAGGLAHYPRRSEFKTRLNHCPATSVTLEVTKSVTP